MQKPSLCTNTLLQNKNYAKTPYLIAIVAPTASGKSALALRLAKALDAEIFSIDSLSIYNYVNIASAKPTPSELDSVRHYGINVLEPNEHCSAGVFCALFQEALQMCKKRVLLLVGGSGFYLDCMLQGLSPMPTIDSVTLESINHSIATLPNAYAFLEHIDEHSAKNIAPQDTYRIHKLLQIYFATNTTPSLYFATHTKSPLITDIALYSIAISREELKDRIKTRTNVMLDSGLLSEARWLLGHYGRDIQPFKAIGLKETLAYFDTMLDSNALVDRIITHTCQLAKRQATFIRSRFPNICTLRATTLYEQILSDVEKIAL